MKEIIFMDIQSEKLFLIEQLARVQDINIIRQLKVVLGQEKSPAGYKPDGTPITQAELVARAKASEEDIKAGRVHTIEEFEKKLDSRLGL